MLIYVIFLFKLHGCFFMNVYWRNHHSMPMTIIGHLLSKISHGLVSLGLISSKAFSKLG
jgi:hypothetical protein